MKNLDRKTVDGFGSEWAKFNQGKLSAGEQKEIYEDYFGVLQKKSPISADWVGADIGCGSGRWAQIVAPKLGYLHLVDASSEALEVAKQKLTDHHNIDFHLASVAELPFENSSLDFAYSLGVLHHVPDTQAALDSIAQKLKPGAPFLVYLYYALDNRPRWFRGLWGVSNSLRARVSELSQRPKSIVCDAIALGVYLPFAKSGALLDRFGVMPESWPLSYYRNCSFYTMRTDALDRFGTRLEQRFTKQQIQTMLDSAGFENVSFSDSQPFWTAVGIKK